jgi:hypothetical protein
LELGVVIENVFNVKSLGGKFDFLAPSVADVHEGKVEARSKLFN